MNIISTRISGLYVVETSPYKDARGEFSRLYCDLELSRVIGARRIVQMNYSRTSSVGAVRGLHFQMPPHAEMKLVRCQKGRVWDVAVDLRKDSPTFLQWHAEELSPSSNRMMVIPEGFAHGFQVLESNSELLYLHTEFYKPEAECGIRYDDPMLNIAWILKPTDLSERDQNHAYIDLNFKGIEQ